MATQPDFADDDDDTLNLTEEQIVDDTADAGDTEHGDDDHDDGGDEQPFIGFADEQGEDEAEETPVIRRLRDADRERSKELHRLRKENADLRALRQPEPEIVVGPRPRPVDFEYDDDAFEKALDEWEERGKAKERQDRAREQAQTRQADEWQGYQRRYEEQRKGLRFDDADDAIARFDEAMSPTTQAVILKHADNAALFKLAVARSPAKLAELQRVDATGDPIALAKVMARMEANMMTKAPTRRAPDPVRNARGTAPRTDNSAKELARLEAEADANGGKRDAVLAFKRKMKEQGK